MKFIEKIINIAAPHNCLSCGSEGSLLCAWCIPEAVEPVPTRCYRCRRMSTDYKVCNSCRASGSKLRYVWVRGEYGGLPKELVYQLKFKRAKAAVEPIARLTDEVLPWLEPEVVIVPVPTATTRQRYRGYDHAELIAKQLAAIRGLTHERLIIRLGQSRQVGAKRTQRLLQLQDSFVPRKTTLIKGARILLVDDVVTSGGTLEAAALTLRKAGARTVDAVAFVQKK